MVSPKNLYARGQKTVEFPFLLSCASFLLDRRFWIIGLRYPWCGVRFDVVARDPGTQDTILVEAKFRSSRMVRPSEMKRFVSELLRTGQRGSVKGFFMTNAEFSAETLQVAKENEVRTFSNVPLIVERVVEGRAGRAGSRRPQL